MEMEDVHIDSKQDKEQDSDIFVYLENNQRVLVFAPLNSLL